MKSIIKNEKIMALICILIITLSYIGEYTVSLTRSGAVSNIDIITAIAVCAGEIIIASAYIVMMKYPMKALLMLVISMIIQIITDLINKKSFSYILNNTIGFMGIVILVSIIINIVIINKKIDKSTIILKKIANTFNYERTPHKIPLWGYILTYTSIIILVSGFSQTTIIQSNIVNKEQWFAMFASLAIILPSVVMILMITTTRLAYSILYVSAIIDICIVIEIAKLYGIENCRILSIIPYIVITIYSVINFYKLDKKDMLNK